MTERNRLVAVLIAVLVVVGVVLTGIVRQGGGVLEFATFAVGGIAGAVVGFYLGRLDRRVDWVTFIVVALVPTFILLALRSPAAIGYFLGFYVVFGLVRGSRP